MGNVEWEMRNDRQKAGSCAQESLEDLMFWVESQIHFLNEKRNKAYMRYVAVSTAVKKWI